MIRREKVEKKLAFPYEVYTQPCFKTLRLSFNKANVSRFVTSPECFGTGFVLTFTMHIKNESGTKRSPGTPRIRNVMNPESKVEALWPKT